jgi:hypothetical protein
MVSIDRAAKMLGANACIVHIPLHEQMLLHDAIVLMEVEYDLMPSLKIFGKPTPML